MCVFLTIIDNYRRFDHNFDHLQQQNDNRFKYWNYIKFLYKVDVFVEPEIYREYKARNNRSWINLQSSLYNIWHNIFSDRRILRWKY